MKSFDRKFGKLFLSGLPSSPGVYFFYDADGQLIYIGKAKNLRRRIGQYRNAKRRKKHLKMRKIVTQAERCEFQTCPTHLEACLLEARLIQEKRPKWNVAGAFYFLYPMIGMKRDQQSFSFCFTTHPDLFPDFEFHGAYRSRYICGEAYFSLMKLLNYVGHPVKQKERVRHSYVYVFRRLPQDWLELWRSFWKGESKQALENLILALVENAGARNSSGKVQEYLNTLARFWRHEASLLAKVRRATAYSEYPVPQKERDLLFVRNRIQKEERSLGNGSRNSSQLSS